MFTLLQHLSVSATREQEILLFEQGKEYFQEKLYDQSIDCFMNYLKKCGDGDKFADSVLYYLGESFKNLTGEYWKTYDMFKEAVS